MLRARPACGTPHPTPVRGPPAGATLRFSQSGGGSEPGPVHAIFRERVARQKGHAQGAKRSRDRPPARLRNVQVTGAARPFAQRPC